MLRMKNVNDVSNETVEMALEAHFLANPEKPKFETISIHGGCFVIEAEGGGIRIKAGDGYNGICCEQGIETIDQFIYALQKAKAFVEANKN